MSSPLSVDMGASHTHAPKPAIVKIEAADKSAEGGKRSSEATVAVTAGGKGAGVAAGDLNVDQTVHVCAEHKKGRKLLKHITELRYRLLKQRQLERGGLSDEWTTRS